MKTLYTIAAPPSVCSYLPEQQSSYRYDIVEQISAAEYEALMHSGWRRFGPTIFRPVCVSCTRCLPLRILVNEFDETTSLRRVRRLAEPQLRLTITTPSVTDEKLALYNTFHDFQSGFKDWPTRFIEEDDYYQSHVLNPFPTEEWQYHLDGELVGVGYVDSLITAMSMIYFFYHPDVRKFSPGTWNIMKGIDEARRRGMTYLNLGYYVQGCRSVEYKGRFKPHQTYDWATQT